VTNFGTFKKRQ
jgi:hypothetical protein